MEKYSIAETLYRLVSQSWTTTYEKAIVALRWFLLVTFLGVVASTIGECHPFNHYWQVSPDPGPKCRLGYAQLATMGTANVITDLILVSLPVPIIVRSSMCLKRYDSISPRMVALATHIVAGRFPSSSSSRSHLDLLLSPCIAFQLL